MSSISDSSSVVAVGVVFIGSDVLFMFGSVRVVLDAVVLVVVDFVDVVNVVAVEVVGVGATNGFVSQRAPRHPC